MINQNRTNQHSAENSLTDIYYQPTDPIPIPQPPIFLSRVYTQSLLFPQMATRYPPRAESNLTVHNTNPVRYNQAQVSQNTQVRQNGEEVASQPSQHERAHMPSALAGPEQQEGSLPNRLQLSHSVDWQPNRSNPVDIINVPYVQPHRMDNNQLPGFDEVMFDIVHVLNPKGLTADQISRFPTMIYGSGWPVEQVLCVVCMSEFIVQDSLRILPCNHGFHKLCVDPWLQFKPTCPLCRHDLSAVFEEMVN